MSRIGKKPIKIPAKTEVTISDGVVTVKGPLGQISKSYKPMITIKTEGDEVILTTNDDGLETNAMWGTYASHITNMIEGVNKEYVKKLIIEGVGYRSEVKGDKLVLLVGFSHPVEIPIPTGIKCTTEKGEITIAGIDKEMVGQFAAEVRSYKKPEPYKGKGIHYSDEVVRRKEGKKAM